MCHGAPPVWFSNVYIFSNSTQKTPLGEENDDDGVVSIASTLIASRRLSALAVCCVGLYVVCAYGMAKIVSTLSAIKQLTG